MTLGTGLYVDADHFSEVRTNHLNLILDVDIKTGLFLQIYIGRIKHVLEKQTVRRLGLSEHFFSWGGADIAQVFITHKFLHKHISSVGASNEPFSKLFTLVCRNSGPICQNVDL